PKLIVGLTVVAYGTSAPEAVVGVQAARTQHADIALGNVIGSNIANLGLILALSVLLRPAWVSGVLRSREVPVLMLTALALPLLLLDGRVAWFESALLLALAAIYTAWMVRDARRGQQLAFAAQAGQVAASTADAAGGPPQSTQPGRALAVALLGLLLLIVGGQLFVQSATALARSWGVSERLVGLTLVAIGTSLPELATSLIASAKGHAEIAVGNVVGSNIFNVLVCLPASALAGSVGAPLAAVVPDLVALVAGTLLGCLFLRSERRITRGEGAVLLLLYLAFVAFLCLAPER
ncbi:MAG: calcium/sodium antiporter, partial [Elusimicrobia bacterium]